MLRKSLMLALAAAAAIGASLLAPTASEAAPGWKGKGAHFGGGHSHFRPHLPPRPHFHPRPHRPHVHIHGGWRRPVYMAAPVIAAAPVVYAATRPVAAAPGPCTCLVKEYTPEGSVLFKDRCTNEMAMNPPMPAPQQTSQISPQLQPPMVYQQAPQQPQTSVAPAAPQGQAR